MHDKDFDLYGLKEQDKSLFNKTMRYMRVYFDLYSEEYYLRKNSLIDKRVWKEWEKGIRYSFAQKPYSEAWQLATSNSKFYDEFAKWVEREVLK